MNKTLYEFLTKDGDIYITEHTVGDRVYVVLCDTINNITKLLHPREAASVVHTYKAEEKNYR
jgi:hypothetical protein